MAESGRCIRVYYSGNDYEAAIAQQIERRGFDHRRDQIIALPESMRPATAGQKKLFDADPEIPGGRDG